MHVHLLVPDLFGLAHSTEGGGPTLPATPALETILARGRKSTQAAASFEAWLMAQFGATDQAESGTAPFALAADGGAPGERIWVHADPVHLRIERDHLVLIEPDPPLEQSGSAALLDTLNERIDPQELRFSASAAGRWYAAIGAMPPLDCAPLARVRGQDISAHLPRGAGGPRWQRLMTEVQMVLHQHPVAAAREALGQLPVNSVWFSGAGRMVPVRAPRAQLICGTSSIARGLAQAAGIECQDVPPGWDALWHADRARTGIVWCIIDALRAPVAYGDQARWAAGLAELERDWVAPLLAALRGRQIGMITLHAFGPGSALIVETTASDLRFLWRRRRPLRAYVNTDALAGN